MSGIFTLRFQWLAVVLVALASFGLGIMATRAAAPVAQSEVKAPPCTSCNARHARLSDLRAAEPKDAE